GDEDTDPRLRRERRQAGSEGEPEGHRRQAHRTRSEGTHLALPHPATQRRDVRRLADRHGRRSRRSEAHPANARRSDGGPRRCVTFSRVEASGVRPPTESTRTRVLSRGYEVPRPVPAVRGGPGTFLRYPYPLTHTASRRRISPRRDRPSTLRLAIPEGGVDENSARVLFARPSPDADSGGPTLARSPRRQRWGTPDLRRDGARARGRLHRTYRPPRPSAPEARADAPRLRSPRASTRRGARGPTAPEGPVMHPKLYVARCLAHEAPCFPAFRASRGRILDANSLASLE